MSTQIHPIASAIHDLAHVYTQCDRLLERLEALVQRPIATPGSPAPRELGRHERAELDAPRVQEQLYSAQGISFCLIPNKKGATKPKAQLCFIVVLAPADADHPDALSPAEPYLLTYFEREDHFDPYVECIELTHDDGFDAGLHGEQPAWLMHSGDLDSRRWNEQPDDSWWAFATRLLELRDDQSLMQRVVAPCLQLLNEFNPDIQPPPGAFHFERDGEGWRCRS